MSRLGDSLIAADQTQALVLASKGDDTDRALATLDHLGLKRKSRWADMPIPKKGRRWGLPDDIPYRPLPYVELPVGLCEKQCDQFLREQRLEDLTRKLTVGELEDCEPDIRPASPPPIYDKTGTRINSREVRIKKAMSAELNRLVRYMLKNVKGYTPPPDWKPQKLAKKLIIPIEKHPTAPFMGVIIGPRGVNHKKLQEMTKCRIVIRGKDITDKWQSDEEMNMPQHVHIEGDTEDQIDLAEKLIRPLLDPESEEFETARNAGMEQLALVNGFSILKSEQRCGLCGAMGHLGFECPENQQLSYQMADVMCSVCGDKGHVAIDCPETLRKQQEMNRDWKQEAEKKREMEKSYAEMMSELGLPNNTPSTAGAPARPGAIGSAGGGVQDGPSPNDYNKDMSIPQSITGRFIGPGGSNIKALSQQTGCTITVEPETENGLRTIIIRGPKEKREVGKKAVENWIRSNPPPIGGGVQSGPGGTAKKPVAPKNAGWKFQNTPTPDFGQAPVGRALRPGALGGLGAALSNSSGHQMPQGQAPGNRQGIGMSAPPNQQQQQQQQNRGNMGGMNQSPMNQSPMMGQGNQQMRGGMNNPQNACVPKSASMAQNRDNSITFHNPLLGSNNGNPLTSMGERNQGPGGGGNQDNFNPGGGGAGGGGGGGGQQFVNNNNQQGQGMGMMQGGGKGGGGMQQPQAGFKASGMGGNNFMNMNVNPNMNIHTNNSNNNNNNNNNNNMGNMNMNNNNMNSSKGLNFSTPIGGNMNPGNMIGKGFSGGGKGQFGGQMQPGGGDQSQFGGMPPQNQPQGGMGMN